MDTNAQSALYKYQSLKVVNILGERFDFDYDALHFWVAMNGEERMDGTVSDGTEYWPRELAEHAAFHIAQKYILLFEPYEGGTDKFSGKTIMVVGQQKFNDENIAEKIAMILPELNNEKVAVEKRTVGEAVRAKVLEKPTKPLEKEFETITREMRQGELEGLDYNNELRPIAQELGLPGNLKKEDMIAEVLRKEFDS